MSRRLKLFLTTDTVGGVWTYSLELASALAAEADTVVILATVGPRPTAEQQAQAAAIPGLQLAMTDLPLDWTASTPEELRSAATALAELATQCEADIVQLHAPAFAAADYPVPVICVVHSCLATWWAAVRGSAMVEDFAWRTELARAGLARASLVITPSRAFARAIQQAYGLTALPIAIHNGRKAPPPSSTAQLDVALTAGRLWDEGKNVALFDQAAKLATTSFLAAGPLRGPNGAAVVLNSAKSLGALDPAELAQQLAARPVFVSAALYEPFGLTILEAAQTGCALVLADIPVFRELWEDAAIFVEPEAESIAATVDLLIARPGEREKLGAAAAERAKLYTPQCTARAMLREYRILLDHGRRAAA